MQEWKAGGVLEEFSGKTGQRDDLSSPDFPFV